MRENRGLSLVELLITIAILAIVIAAATSFMITGSRSFAKGNADSELQKEAELAVNQIEDMIIDVNGGMDLTDDDNRTELVMYHGEIKNDVAVYTKESVAWDKSGDKITYGKWDVSYDESAGSYTENSTEYEDQLLTENVAAFEVDIDTTNETALDGTVRTYVRSVQIRVGYESSTGQVDYATSPIITLRNRMMLSGNPEEIFEDFEAPTDTFKLWYSGSETLGIIPIIDYSSTVQRGGNYTIYARLNRGEGVMGGDISHLVNWELETANTLSTINASTGELKVGEFEPNDTLTITARYKNNPSKKATGIVLVDGNMDEIKSLTDITINERWRELEPGTNINPFTPLFGSHPTLEGDWKISEIAAIQYTWEILSGAEYVESYTPGNDGSAVKYATLDMKIKEESASYGKSITIKLTAHSDVTGETVATQYTYMISPENTTGGDSNMKRGMGVDSGHKNINYTFDFPFNDWPIPKVEWECYFCDVNGNKVTEANEKYYDCIVFTPKSTGQHSAYYTLTFTEDLPLNQEFNVKVICRMEQDEIIETWWPEYTRDVITHTWSYERIHNIPAVSLYDRHEYNYIDAQNFDFYYGVLAFYEVSWPNTNPPVFEYRIEEFDYDAPDGITVTAEIVQTTVADVERIRARGTLSNNAQYGSWDGIKLKSMKVRVSLAGHSEVSTLVSIYFNQD